ncbi:MAG: hypothetical protein NTX22_07535 [Ignavibacteriales bacterium]|nr:hypothetical protein [Ignavibacteriales bacterium]
MAFVKLNLSPEKKLIESLKLYYLARELKFTALKKFNPQLTEKDIREKVKEIFSNART